MTDKTQWDKLDLLFRYCYLECKIEYYEKFHPTYVDDIEIDLQERGEIAKEIQKRKLIFNELLMNEMINDITNCYAQKNHIKKIEQVYIKYFLIKCFIK